jgi:hypothetical protein
VASDAKKRRSGVPTGNAGEYFVMGELLRQGYDAQLADRNTKDYDILVGKSTDTALRKVQVKSVRSSPWYVSWSQFEETNADMVTIYVLIGPENSKNPVRYFIAKNGDLVANFKRPDGWKNGFVSLKAIESYEDNWSTVIE